MSTIRQKKLANAIIENLVAKQPLNKGELVESVGYSVKSAEKKTNEIINSKGVQQELVAFGFNEDKAKEVVAEILVAGENDTVKLKAAEMIFKVQGSFAPEKHLTLNVQIEPSERLKKIAQVLNEN